MTDERATVVMWLERASDGAVGLIVVQVIGDLLYYSCHTGTRAASGCRPTNEDLDAEETAAAAVTSILYQIYADDPEWSVLHQEGGRSVHIAEWAAGDREAGEA
jgi:hypothetical protein